ncbi:MAG: hypothetical protein PVH93_05880 [Nitrosopumilaceae archaeon]|jgi:hypothetical protein
MKTRFLIIIAIVTSVVIYLPIHYYLFLEIDSTTESLTLCDDGFIKRGNECFPDISTLDPNTILIYPIHSPNQVRITPLPNTAVIYLEKNNTVTWINESDSPSMIYDRENKWLIESIEPRMQKQIKFNKTGFYEYFVENSIDRGHGRLALVSNDTDSLPYYTKLEIARAIVEQDLDSYPIVGLGIGNAQNSLGIDIDKKYLEENPDAHSFFMNRYTKMIPFDVKITIEFGEPIRALTG